MSDYSRMSDAELLKLAAQGDLDAQEEYMNRHDPERRQER